MEMLTDKELLGKLTIAIPVYNELEFIGKTIDSCIEQAGQVWIYDNCSTDGTSEICAEYARKFPHVTHIRHEKNIGAFENFRLPLFACQTEYFQWLGAHDMLGKDYSLNLLRVAEKDPSSALAFGRIECVDENGLKLKIKDKTRYTEKMLRDNPFERMKTLLLDLRNCLILHGVFKTEQARKSWMSDRCIGFDDSVLLKAASLGKFGYAKKSTLFVREFPTYRKNVDNRQRQADIIIGTEEKPIEKNLNQMVAQMIEITTSVPQYRDNLAEGFQVLDCIRKRYLEPKKEMKARRNKIIFLFLFFFVFASFLTISYFYLKHP